MPDLTKSAARVIMFALAALFVLAVIVGGYNALTARPKAEARLGRNTTEAAGKSGQDAVATVGRQNAAEDAADTITRENDHAIRNAEGAAAPVAPAADRAGRLGLCRRAAYRERPECVQFTPAR